MATRQVLLVEDDEGMMRMFERWFRDEGFNVVPCTGFEQARLYLASHVPDIVVTDVRLGSFNGLHLVVLAKQANPATIAIVVSGFDDPVIEQEALRAGASYLVKPLQRHQLLACAELGHG